MNTQSPLSKLNSSLLQLRNQISTIPSQQAILAQKVCLIHQELTKLILLIKQYLKWMEEKGENVESASVKTINLYLWQLLNFICINQGNIPQELTSLILPMFKIQVNHQCLFSAVSLKNGLIFIYNWLLRITTQTHIQTILNIICLILEYLFSNKQKQKNKNLSKKQQQYFQQMEWIGYIFSFLFKKDINLKKNKSLIQEITEISNHPRISYFLLHVLGNYLENMIDTRVTTELVAGYPSHLQEIKETYKSKQKIVQLTLSVHDIEYIAHLFKEETIKYKEIVRKHLTLNIQKQNTQKLQQQWTKNADMTTEIGHLFNCCLFLGGYSKDIQGKITSILLENDNFLLDYFQLSYILYRNIESTRYKSKVHLISEMESEVKKKLFQAVDLPLVSKLEQSNYNMKQLSLEKLLAPGQLVFLLRLLTNLVHINHRAQMPFEKDFKYIHMILSMTHDSVSQATMKQWAIMFIKNVTEWSQILRQQIAKVKIQMKVQ